MTLARMDMAGSLLTVLLVAAMLGGDTATAVRVCVTGHNAATACRKMEARKSSIPLECFTTQDSYDCLLRLVSKEADVALAGAEDVYLATQMLDGKVHVVAQTRQLSKRTESMRYDSVAVVRRSTIKSLDDLKGSKSCHTGYRRTAGWHIPIALLLEMKKLKLSCGSGQIAAEQDLKAVSDYFGLACVPGHWAPDNKTNTMLKAKYPNLCAMCGSPSDCSDQDEHSGYLGALNCLTQANADVAWTKQDAVQLYFNNTEKNEQKHLYGLLCPDGTVRDVDQVCPWASRPWDAWLTRTGHEDTDKITKALKMAMKAAIIGNEETSTKVEEWATQVLGIYSPSTVVPFNPPTTPYKYLSSASYVATIERETCPTEPIRLCVNSKPAVEKCRALAQLLKSRRVHPALACEMPNAADSAQKSSASCIMTIVGGRADITTLDGADVFRGHAEYDLRPLVTEKYGLQESSYFAVAVVKANSGIHSLRDLRGKKSCHTGYDRTAGWKIPITALLEVGLLKKNDCNFAHEIGGLFSASCVPGAKSRKYDPTGNNPESLCELCVGRADVSVGNPGGTQYSVAGASGDGRCNRDESEAFYGYSGAFRCLVEGGGDVAFVKHTTVGEVINSDASANNTWAHVLQPQDFRLLCKGGSSADIVDFATCHLARVPSHKVVVNNKLSQNRQEEARVLMLAASTYFPKGQNNFVLFGPFHGHNDVIFKDSATELVNLPDDVFHNSIDEAYYRMLTELMSCSPLPGAVDNHGPVDGSSPSAYDAQLTAESGSCAHQHSAVLGAATLLSVLLYTAVRT